MEKSQYFCPCCRQQLNIEKQNQTIILYCGYGSCVCIEMNDGAEGTTELEALQKLENLFETFVK